MIVRFLYSLSQVYAINTVDNINAVNDNQNIKSSDLIVRCVANIDIAHIKYIFFILLSFIVLCICKYTLFILVDIDISLLFSAH